MVAWPLLLAALGAQAVDTASPLRGRVVSAFGAPGLRGDHLTAAARAALRGRRRRAYAERPEAEDDYVAVHARGRRFLV